MDNEIEIASQDSELLTGLSKYAHRLTEAQAIFLWAGADILSQVSQGNLQRLYFWNLLHTFMLQDSEQNHRDIAAAWKSAFETSETLVYKLQNRVLILISIIASLIVALIFTFLWGASRVGA